MPKHHRWFQFGLSTMFLVVSALACFLGYHKNWIQHRQRFIDEQRQFARFRIVPDRRAPGLLPYFGETGYDKVTVHDVFPFKNVQRARTLFPEAEIVVFDVDGNEVQYLGRNVRRFTPP